METGVTITLFVFGAMVLIGLLIAVVAAIATVSGFHSPQQDEKN